MSTPQQTHSGRSGRPDLPGRAAAATPGGRRPARIPGTATGAVTRIAVALCLVFILFPVLISFIVATSMNSAQGLWGGGATGQWLVQAWEQINPTLGRSATVALGVVAANLALGGPLAMWLARSGSPLTRAVSFLATLPLAVPGIALSIGLITVYPELRPSGVLLFAGHVLFTLPFTLAALAPVFGERDLRDCEDVAFSLGAPAWRVLATVTVPVSAAALIQAVITAFALSFGEFNISFFINPPAAPMAPFALFDAYSTQRLELASAKTALFILCIVPVLLIVVLSQRITRSTKGPKA
ncbi:ABC transporter permease [Sediminivirga luteola]|uniref:ABC transporter permease n=1 Tax=Sediminivirga luteola TaxID=1774748 RepID=UPI001F5A6090|nr:ABC transporter permease subunit [Sediminivirga luteola]MCI2266092.1 ABC transporter permease subunit [Sediminivirga luteola]